MNNNKTYYDEKLIIINAEQSLIKLQRRSVTFLSYRHDEGRVDKDSYRQDCHAYSFSHRYSVKLTAGL